jgi:hypothetical protein
VAERDPGYLSEREWLGGWPIGCGAQKCSGRRPRNTADPEHSSLVVPAPPGTPGSGVLSALSPGAGVLLATAGTVRSRR